MSSLSITEREARFIDIGVNLSDPVFHGKYYGKQRHPDDMDAVLERCRTAGVQSMIITGGSLHESRTALRLAKQHGFYATVGCHPTRVKDFEKFNGGPEAYLQALDVLIKGHLNGAGRVVAVGECGLDYDRTRFASEAVQRTHFRSQLALAKKYHLPLFLHSRAAHVDFVKILKEEGFGVEGGKPVGAAGGVVHSFTGTAEEAAELLNMGFYLSVNGCSFKTENQLRMAKTLPLEKLLLETDAPWCSMTSTQASKQCLDSLPARLRALYLPPARQHEKFELGSPVKGRNEPIAIGGVAWVMHRLHPEVPFLELTEGAWKNTIDLFKLDELKD